MDTPLGLSSFAFFTGQLGATGVDSNPDTGPVTSTIPKTITLDGWTYAIDLAPTNGYEFGPQDTFRDGVVASEQPNDSLFNARGAWARYRYGWHHGADQEIADLDDTADPFRFDESYGFDVWDRFKLQMLPYATLNDDGLSVNSGDPILLRSSNYLFLGDGSTLMRNSPNGAVWSTVTAPGGTIQSLASDGTDLYVATSTVMKKYAGTDTTATAFGTPVTGNCTKVAFVGNRLLLAKANVLYEVAAAGTLTTIETHYQPAFRWTTIFSIGSRIYFGGYSGVKSELYAAVVDSAGALVKGQEAAPFPIGEQLLCALSYGGAVLLGTSAGIRFAQTGADGTLTYGPLIDAPGAVYSIAADKQFAWFTWNNTDTDLGFVGVGRLDLSTFVDVLQPAYAMDISSHSDAAGEVMSVERYNDQTFFASADTGVYYAADDGNTSGEVSLERQAKLTSGRFFFGTVEPKGLVELKVMFEELPAGATVEVSIFSEDGGLLGYGLQNIAATTELNVPINGGTACEVTVELVVVRSGEEQVLIRHWRLRAYPAPPQVLQFIVPINTHASVRVGDGEGYDMPQDPQEVLDRIEALNRSKRLCNYSIGTRTYRVRVESFKLTPRKWTDDGLALQGIVLVQLVSAG